MYLEIIKTHKGNGNKIVTICNYGYFLKRGKWEAIVINLRPIAKSIWIYRKRNYKNEWPVCCG